ncbi:hypothetical protein HETIRDRAFT_412780 [Heterobasidion irregulare TC 32-1]|uniref:Uncharacterized protein n=1 Tax=Heterobasidion irregulare (strain TC 32-1) TaxID=747525 RepID=W4JMY5_HETIT|nr:uncharacterized protein HETIRDRAFT_412780 [Heterobasidion irregulare TC 32-1]ETW74893.1 hypothetical protein HETIRDRAFT_412780 [Heterobasidion irregulare TC 32-1]
MMLVVLCLTVSVLLYIRGRWVERLRREERQQQNEGQVQQQEDRGLPVPLRGDPARDDWAVLR